MKEKKVLVQMYLEPYLAEMIDKKAKMTFRSKVQYIKDLIMRDIDVNLKSGKLS